MAKRKNADEDYQLNGLNKKHKIDLNVSDFGQDFVLSREVVENAILRDKTKKPWRIGKPIGKGSFGEIFLASDNISRPVTTSNADYVVKIEPHLSGPLFVEIHCLINTGKSTEDVPLPTGMPEYIASGTHHFGEQRYRFLILHRYECDLHSLIKNRRVDPKHVLIIADQIIDILEHFHDKGYAHSDIKAENLMIGSCTFFKNNPNSLNNSRSSSDNNNRTDYENMYNQRIYNNNDDSIRKSGTPRIEFSGSNPMRQCRGKGSLQSSIYAEMLKSHYLRPSKKINYDEELCDVFDDDSVIKRLCNSQNGINKRKENRLTSRQDDLEKNREVSENRIFLIDFGLASKFVERSGKHRPFCMDQRRAHDGTLEFTSRDAHMGAHSRRSDLECLGYNLIYWCQGTLPWKDDKLLQQPEQVHHMKEYFMTDVDYMLRQIYGPNVPKFLAEFMLYVGNLAYDERPDYGFCKFIFEKAFTSYGYKPGDMVLNINDLKQSSKKIKQVIPENLTNIKHIKSIMKLSMMIPFRDSNGPNKISPKNLRSKTDSTKLKKGKKFSWTEILNTDPDQIARQRAEKEFERDLAQPTPVSSKYTGRPTYAILRMERKIKFKDRLDQISEKEIEDDNIDLITKGYTKSMIQIVKKRQSGIGKLDTTQEQIAPRAIMDQSSVEENLCISDTSSSDHDESSDFCPIRRRRHVGLRKFITPTKKSLHYNKIMRQRKRKYSSTCVISSNDETSCGSNTSSTDVCDNEVSDNNLNKFASNTKPQATAKRVVRRGPGRPPKKKSITKNSIDENIKERAFSRG